MIGVAAEGPGRLATQFTFSDFENLVGNPFSGVEPLNDGPRHCGQSSARTNWEAKVMSPPSVKSRVQNFLPPFIHCFLDKPSGAVPFGLSIRDTGRASFRRRVNAWVAAELP